jgi:hypothetical protein
MAYTPFAQDRPKLPTFHPVNPYKTMFTISYSTAKEELGQFKFSTEDVLLNDTGARQSRAYNLLRAERLGNAFHGKVRIFFNTQDAAERTVETTVWAATDDYVILKGGVILPVRAISRVEFA